MRGSAVVGLACAAAILALLAGAAQAQTIVVEVHVGRRPPGFARLVAPVVRALEAAPGTIAGPEVARRFVAERSRSGAADGETAALQARVRALVSAGVDAWNQAEFARARRIFRRAVDVARQAPGDLAGSSTWRPLVQRAIVGVAQAARREHDDLGAEAAMTELIRSYPDEPFDRASFGPEAATLYEAVRRRVARQPTGRLAVIVDDADAVVLVNERYAGVGSIAQAGLVPGTYRVHVRKGGAPGRVYAAEVVAGAETALRVAWDFDATIVTADWVGFVFPDQASRRRLLFGHVRRLGRLLGARTVIVLESSRERDRTALTGAVVAVDSGQPIRTASMTTAPIEPTADRLATLGRYLAGEAGVVLDDAAPAPAARSRRTALLWTAAGLGGAAVATGLTLLATDGTCVGGGRATGPGACAELYDTARLGGVATTVGALAVTGAAYLYLTRDRTGPTPVVAASGRGALIGVAARF